MVLSLACGAALAQGGPYGGQQRREIKALSAEEQADLSAGRGMGLARAAELNHYPGPAHVLEHEAELHLTPEQARSVRASFARMNAAARAVGAGLLGRERELDAMFRDGTITAPALAQRTAEIAALQGRLRAIHLGAHLEVRSVLTPEQVSTYDRVRGYAEGASTQHMHLHPG
jgi:Spy/CpxP family protein refolding chaperone